MPRGGKRDGAGRKVGVHNKASIERQRRVAETGITPLDVILKRMRYHDRRADKALSEDRADEAERHMREAEEAANRAAPYVHPKLSTMQHTGAGGGPIATVDLTNATDDDLARLETLFGAVAGAPGGTAEADQGGEGEEG